jgi:hypothetical protein
MKKCKLSRSLGSCTSRKSVILVNALGKLLFGQERIILVQTCQLDAYGSSGSTQLLRNEIEWRVVLCHLLYASLFTYSPQSVLATPFASALETLKSRVDEVHEMIHVGELWSSRSRRIR